MKLSIITVNLNNRDGLQKTIDSVVDQTVQDFEWLVIDGGSTDGSKELLEQNADHFAYWVSEPDKGIFNAMNKGILKAKGDYCLFLNSGDWLVDRDVLFKMLNKGMGADVFYGNIVVERGDTREIEKQPTEVTLSTFVLGTINHSGCSFIRRNMFDRFGLYDESLQIVSDWKFFLQAVGLGEATTQYVDEEVSVFDLNGFGTVNVELCEKERRAVLESCVPSRILKDYWSMEKERQLYREREQAIKTSIAYRIGRAVGLPVRLFKTIFFKK